MDDQVIRGTIVVGLGNPYLGDDGVGVAVAWELEKMIRDPAGRGVYVTEASVGGVRLMETLIGYDRAILIDALKVEKPNVGRIHRWTMEDLLDLAPTQHSASAHDTNLPTAIAAGRRMGYRLPEEITIFAVEVERVDEFDEQLSPVVALAVPEVVRMVLDEISSPEAIENQVLAASIGE